MANLTPQDLVKAVPGDKTKKRFHILVEKIKTKSPFELKNGSSTVLKYLTKSTEQKFKNAKNVLMIKGPVLVDSKKNSYKITDLVKTAEFGGGGGSGAGAAVTKLAESAQCLYAGLSFYVKKKKITSADANKQNLTKAINFIDTDEVNKKMINDLPTDWVKSSIVGANVLLKTFKKQGYIFHRGSKSVDLIENKFKEINKTEGAFGNLNKWSPADIYIIKKGFQFKDFERIKTLKSLNDYMLKKLKSKEVIGVSLKKIVGDGKLSYKNIPSKTDSKKDKIKYTGYQINPTAIDCYLLAEVNGVKIQFRSFGGEVSLTGWQGEVKGASANQGKISLGPLNYVLKIHKLKLLPLDSANKAKSTSATHMKLIASLLKKYTKQKIDVAFVKGQSNKWRYSKYLCLMIIDILENVSKNKAGDILKDIYLYASSQSVYSGPYVKLE